MIAAVWNHSLNRSVFMTGTVKTDGTVGAVGGIPYKALAAAQEGGTTFIVPKGQSVVAQTVARETQPIPGLTLVRYEQIQVKLSDLLKQEGFNIKVVEVMSILEAYNIFRFG
jgi:predicted S18 family serine protease